MAFDPAIFRKYDIRGVFPKQFDSSFAYLLGKAFYSFSKARFPETPLVFYVGQDIRASGKDLSDALIEGLRESGAHIFLLGKVTTPMCSFAASSRPSVAGSIMVTGSHNPPEHNGFKMTLNKRPICGDDIIYLKQIMESKNFYSQKGSVEFLDIFPLYLKRHQARFSSLKDRFVFLDCGNGASGLIARKLYASVGVDFEILHEAPDGLFPNHPPDPTNEQNLTTLIERCKKSKSLGFAFDGDADRIGVVSEKGRLIPSDEIMSLFVKALAKDHSQMKVIADVKCSPYFFEDVKEIGGQPILWKSGHSFIKEKILDEGAILGGEFSGHIFFNDDGYCFDDGLYVGLRLLEILSKTESCLEDEISWPEIIRTPEIRIDVGEEKKELLVKKAASLFSDRFLYQCDFLDGVRVKYKDGFALIRASQTQPFIVLRMEATSEKTFSHLKKRIEKFLKENTSYNLEMLI